MRGKDPDCRFLIFSAGITPACAGKRLDALLVFFRCQDHPRVCGEKTLSPPFKSNHGGSPPRVRGKALLFCLSNLLPRITPACAGKSSLTSGYIPARGDHPRVCGEKLSFGTSKINRIGSPPRVRGKDHDDDRRKSTVRITPACAGKSF